MKSKKKLNKEKVINIDTPIGEVEITKEALERGEALSENEKNEAIENSVPIEYVIPENVTKEIENKIINESDKNEDIKVSNTIKRVLYAVDSPAMDAKIKEDSQDKFKKVTVLVKDRESNASVNKYLKSEDLRLITTFAIQFQGEDFDVAFVEKSMVEFIPEKILKKLKS